MQDIRRLKCFKSLAEMGFREIKFHGPGKKVVAIGAALQRTAIDLHGHEFPVDIICIEPMPWSRKERYMINGTYIERYPLYMKKPAGGKEFVGTSDNCHEYIKAVDILKKVSELKTTYINV